MGCSYETTFRFLAAINDVYGILGDVSAGTIEHAANHAAK
jgi:hypothetical protein